MRKRKGRIMLLLIALLSVMNQALASDDYNNNRTDFRDESIYFVITTRFYDGDPANNVLCWDNTDSQEETSDPCWRGDFKGLIEKLDYIKALGFSAIWITPIVQNASGYDYHGYHAMDFSRVDCRYESSVEQGSEEDCDFQDLIDAAHEKDMKIILDIVLNHTGNFGEEGLIKEFDRNYKIKNQASIDACMIPNEDVIGDDYADLDATSQYNRRLAMLKNTDGNNNDTKNYYHHVANDWNWDEPSRWWGQIAGDCVDLNTENDAVAEYLVDCYGEFIKMGVDGFRIDTSGHIARLTFNKVFIPQFTELGEQYASLRLNNATFFMFGEVCARYSGVTYRDQPVLSPYFYTWESPSDLLSEWDNYDADWWAEQYVAEGDEPLGNMLTCLEDDDFDEESDNAFLSNGSYHTPDYSESSGFNVIDFPLHYNFNNAASAYALACDGDKYYNDATFNVVYVDSHDYGPQPNDGVRFSGDDAQWAENLSLMFTFRGIPCLYYGSEIGFRRGYTIDNGTNGPLSNTGRAYYGGYITGDVEATDFGEYTATGNALASLDQDLSQHLIRLNKIRQAVPALRKGQWSSDGCTANDGGIAFKRAYEDSYALVSLNGGATFTDCPSGTFVDVVTGTSYTGGGTITVSAPSNQGQVRVLVKDWTGGQIGEDGPFIYTSSSSSKSSEASYDGTQEDGTDEYYTADDAEGTAAVEFDPSGCNFKTETLDITISLNEDAVSGTYTLDGETTSLSSGDTKTVTIGSDMEYKDTKEITWTATNSEGTEYSGTETYKKVDPNATITVYVNASSAPYLYVWDQDDEEPNGSWPGTKMSQTTEVSGTTYYYQVFADVDYINIVLNNGSSGTGNQTSDITDIDEDIYLTYDGGSTYEIVEAGEGDNEVEEDSSDDSSDDSSEDSSSDSSEDSEGITIYVNSSSAPYLYVWTGSSTELNGSWPGTRMENTTEVDGTTYYYATFDASYINIIFNDGSGNQTADITGITEDTYFYYDGSTSYSIITTSSDYADFYYDDVDEDDIYAFFINTPSWSTVYSYSWTSDNGSVTEYSASWSGDKCSDTGEEISGYDVYVWKYSGSLSDYPGYIIFNNGSSQTADLEFVNGGFYTYDGYTGYTYDPSSSGIRNIEGVSTSDISLNENGEIEVYNVLGQKVGTFKDASTLSKKLPVGIYIANGQKITVK